MFSESAKRQAYDARTPIREPDRLIAALANRQYGVVTRRQLLEAGLGREMIRHRLQTARLHRLHAGVYAAGHRVLRREARWMAAVLAAGPAAVLSHRSAAVLWGLRRADPDEVEVTVPRSTHSSGRLRRHSAKLPKDEVTLRNRIPVTTVGRTLFDLAATLTAKELERALREAEVLRLPLRPSLPELLTRHPGQRGARTLRSVLDRLSQLPGGVSRSYLEDRFLRLALAVGLPPPETNVKIRAGTRPYEADCLWREQRLILELDGYETHGTRAAFESDRQRDRRLVAAGWTVVHATDRQLDEGDEVASDIRSILALRQAESA